MTKGEGELPVRIQRRRARGWRLPANTVIVCRPSKLGNPFDWREAKDEFGCTELEAKQWAKDAHLELCMLALSDHPNKPTSILSGERVEKFKADLREAMPSLAGKNVACFCGPDEPCHGDNYLMLANPKGEGDE